MKFKIGKIVLGIILLFGTFYVGTIYGDSNRKFVYGKTGLPRNCRAIISANIQAWQEGTYTAEEILDSINRNCGATGYAW